MAGNQKTEMKEMLEEWCDLLSGGDVSKLAEKHGLDNSVDLIGCIQRGRASNPEETDIDKIVALGKDEKGKECSNPKPPVDVDRDDLSQLEIDSLYETRLEKIPKPVWTDLVHTLARNYDQSEEDLEGRTSCGSAITGPYQDFHMAHGQRLFNVETLLGQMLFTLFPFLATIRLHSQVPPQEQVFRSAYKRLKDQLYVGDSDSDYPAEGTGKRLKKENSPQPKKIRKGTHSKSQTKSITDQDDNIVGHSDCHHPIWPYNPVVGFPGWLCPPCRGKSRTLWFQSTDMKQFMANSIQDKEGLQNVICCRCKTVSKATTLLTSIEKESLPVWYCASCATGTKPSKNELTFEKLVAVSLNLICCALCGKANFCPGKLNKVDRDNLPFWLCPSCHISEVAKSTQQTLTDCRQAICEQLIVETQLREEHHMRGVFRKKKEIEMECSRRSNTAYTEALCKANKDLYYAQAGLFRIECRFCGGTGHNSSTCFHLSQYADRLIKKEGRAFCSLCLRKDHAINQCWYEEIESGNLIRVLNKNGLGFVADLQSNRQHVHSHMSVLFNELVKTLPHTTKEFPEPVDNEYRMTQVLEAVIRDNEPDLDGKHITLIELEEAAKQLECSLDTVEQYIKLFLRTDNEGVIENMAESQHQHSHSLTTRLMNLAKNQYLQEQKLTETEIESDTDSVASLPSPVDTTSPKLPPKFSFSASLPKLNSDQLSLASGHAELSGETAQVKEGDGPEVADSTSQDTFLVLDSYSASASPKSPGIAEVAASEAQPTEPQPDFSKQLKTLVAKMKKHNPAYTPICDQLEKQVSSIDNASK